MIGLRVMEMAKVGLQRLKPATKTTLKRVSAFFRSQHYGDISMRNQLYRNCSVVRLVTTVNITSVKRCKFKFKFAPAGTGSKHLDIKHSVLSFFFLSPLSFLYPSFLIFQIQS